MARIRTIKPEFWGHPVMGRLEGGTKALALALLNLADDEGFFLADPNLVRAFADPFSDSSVNTHGALTTLQKVGWIEVRFHPTHGPIGMVLNFDKHQVINRPNPSKIKLYFDSVSNHGVITEDSHPEQGTGNREQEQGKEQTPQAARVPLRAKSSRRSLMDFTPEVLSVTEHAMRQWPETQPDGKTPVPGKSPVQFAQRVSYTMNGPEKFTERELIAAVDLYLAEALARRLWLKAPQFWLGKDPNAPAIGYLLVARANLKQEVAG